MNPPVRSIKNHLTRIFEDWKQESIDDDYIGDEEMSEAIFIRQFYDDLGDFRKFIEDKYKTQLRKKNQWYPKKWMVEDPAIASLLERYRICDILNTLEKKQSSRKAGKQIYAYLTPPVIGEFATFMADADFYKAILPELEMAKITLQKYLAAFCKAGILQLVDKDGRNHIPIYALGSYSDYKGSPKLNRFLTKENKDGLRKFKL